MHVNLAILNTLVHTMPCCRTCFLSVLVAKRSGRQAGGHLSFPLKGSEMRWGYLVAVRVLTMIGPRVKGER